MQSMRVGRIPNICPARDFSMCRLPSSDRNRKPSGRLCTHTKPDITKRNR
jgi:hypothetical protein